MKKNGTYTIGELTKECQKQGLKIKGPAVIDYLCQRGFLKRSEGKNVFTLPTDISYEKGLMEIEKIKINNYVHVHAVITDKGMDYFVNRIIKHCKVPNKLF